MHSCRQSKQTGWHVDRMKEGFDFFDFPFFSVFIYQLVAGVR